MFRIERFSPYKSTSVYWAFNNAYQGVAEGAYKIQKARALYVETKKRVLNSGGLVRAYKMGDRITSKFERAVLRNIKKHRLTNADQGSNITFAYVLLVDCDGRIKVTSGCQKNINPFELALFWLGNPRPMKPSEWTNDSENPIHRAWIMLPKLLHDLTWLRDGVGYRPYNVRENAQKELQNIHNFMVRSGYSYGPITKSDNKRSGSQYTLLERWATIYDRQKLTGHGEDCRAFWPLGQFAEKVYKPRPS